MARKRLAKDGSSAPAGEPRGETAYLKLKEAIRTGELKPGQRVRESEMAARLDVSRTPVREAFRRLEADGLLSFAPYRGMVISELDHQAVMELYFMREVLEGTAAGLAARRASDAEIQILQELVSLDPGSKGRAVAVAGHNRRFHGSLYHAAHNRYLLKTLNVLQDAMALLGPTTMEVPGRSDEAKQEHCAIVAAIADKDAELAERLMREHIRGAQKARLHLLASAEDE